MTAFCIRQGDVLIVAAPDAVEPDTAPTPAEHGRVVLAHGEATGHHHSYAATDRIRWFREDGSGGGLLVIGPGSPAPLEHQEHSAIPTPAGTFRVIRQREYTPEAIRNVAD